MRSRIARDISRGNIGRVAESFSGAPRAVVAFGANRAANAGISARYHLPVDPEELELQNAAGAFLFLADYSALGGPDVVT